jgi:predicted deacylase
LPSPWSEYRDATSFDEAWCALARKAGARVSEAGTSVEARPIRRFDFGRGGGPTILLTGLVHAIEFIGSVALFDFVRALTTTRAGEELLGSTRLVVLPIVNPDGLAANTGRMSAGRRAFRRGNANGVDLNRNFPPLTARRPLHPFAGSRHGIAPHYAGPFAFSEPETRAVRDVALATRPAVSVGFHSMGELLLYPWAFTARPNPKKARYERVGSAFRNALPRAPYRVMQAVSWYSTVGDLDDWLDAELGTMAFTVEVSRPMARLADVRRALDPFAWMNPTKVEPATSNLTPGVHALLREALAA